MKKINFQRFYLGEYNKIKFTMILNIFERTFPIIKQMKTDQAYLFCTKSSQKVVYKKNKSTILDQRYQITLKLLEIFYIHRVKSFNLSQMASVYYISTDLE